MKTLLSEGRCKKVPKLATAQVGGNGSSKKGRKLARMRKKDQSRNGHRKTRR